MRMFWIAKEKAVSEAELEMNLFRITEFPILARMPIIKNGGIR
jgi:hypothetical protein